jgi:hypothetical protein
MSDASAAPPPASHTWPPLRMYCTSTFVCNGALIARITVVFAVRSLSALFWSTSHST